MERITTAHDRFAGEIGFDYGAGASSDVQAQFLNGFAKGLSYEGSTMQTYYIAHDMTDRARQFFIEFGKECDTDES